MENREKKLIGVFRSDEDARQVIGNLKDMGYTDDEISVLAKNIDGNNHEAIKDDDGDGAVAGAVTGGVIGGAGALLAELGVFAIPGIGPLLAAGPIAATLGGLVTGGAVGGIAGALVDLGLEDDQEIERYEGYLNDGNIIVAVDQKPDFPVENIYGHYYDYNSIIRNEYPLNR